MKFEAYKFGKNISNQLPRYLNGPVHIRIICGCSLLYAAGSETERYAISVLIVKRSSAGFIFGDSLAEKDDI